MLYLSKKYDLDSLWLFQDYLQDWKAKGNTLLFGCFIFQLWPKKNPPPVCSSKLTLGAAQMQDKFSQQDDI